MPTNLPAEARHKWNQVSLARTPEEKVQVLQEFLSLVPKHKGTARLCANVKRQIAILRREIEEKKRRRAGKRGQQFFIEKDGAAQLVVVGLTKVGRSSLLSSVTNAKVTVSDRPYTTRSPVPGMFQYEDVYLQMVEAPAFTRYATDERLSNLTMGLCRNSDMLIIMVDLTQDPVAQLEIILSELEKGRINVQKRNVKVEIERKPATVGLRVIIFGRLHGCTVRDVEELLRSYKIMDAIVKIYGDITLDDVEEAIFGGTIDKPAIVLANKTDAAGADERLSTLRSFVNGSIQVIPISCKVNVDTKMLGKEIFKSLDLVRVYTKEPSDREPSHKPFILKKHATVQDLAKKIHSEFYEKFSYAKVWAKRLRFSPQKVGLSFILEDGDVVELHIR